MSKAELEGIDIFGSDDFSSEDGAEELLDLGLEVGISVGCMLPPAERVSSPRLDCESPPP